MTRSSDGAEASIYWLHGAGLDKLASDALTAHAIGAAAFDAMKTATDADTLIVTRSWPKAMGRTRCVRPSSGARSA